MTDELDTPIAARIDELQRILIVFEAGGDVGLAIKDRLEQLYPEEYEAYRTRWLSVPGDHAPGRLLAYTAWQELAEELAGLVRQVEATGTELSQRGRHIRKALLMRDP